MPSVTGRISNPWMPNGTANLTNSPTPFYAPGEIGMAFNNQSTGRTHLRVKLDSGATNVTPVGAVANGQLAFWKDRKNAIVTNDSRFTDVSGGVANGFVNRVAGIFQTTVSAVPNVNGSDGQPLQYVCDLVIAGTNVTVASDGTGAAGDYLVASTAAGTAQVTAATNATTAPVSQPIGIAKTAPVAGLLTADVNIGFID